MASIGLKCFFSPAGKKRKEQHDVNQAGMGLNPAYPGAYGGAPPVRIMFLFHEKSLVSI